MTRTLERLVIAARQAEMSLCLDAVDRAREYLRQITRELNAIEKRVMAGEEVGR